MSGKTAERRIPARFLLEETEQGFRLSFSADDGTECSKLFLAEHQPARTDQTGTIREVLGKLGDTPYVCTDVEVRFSQPWFIPRSTLAEWRRSLTPDPSPRRGENQAGNSQDNAIINTHHQNTPLLGEEHGERLMTCRFCLRHAWGQCHKERSQRPLAAIEMVNGTPRLQSRLGAKASEKLSNGKWQDPLFLVLGDGRRFRLHFDCKKCEMSLTAT